MPPPWLPPRLRQRRPPSLRRLGPRPACARYLLKSIAGAPSLSFARVSVATSPSPSPPLYALAHDAASHCLPEVTPIHFAHLSSLLHRRSPPASPSRATSTSVHCRLPLARHYATLSSPLPPNAPSQPIQHDNTFWPVPEPLLAVAVADPSCLLCFPMFSLTAEWVPLVSSSKNHNKPARSASVHDTWAPAIYFLLN